jgi:putative tryptophan/tyrosine transport system substrate-binding protein
MRRLPPILVGACAALLFAISAAAQQRSSGGIPRVGILTSAENERTPLLEAFRQGLRELGYVEGRNIVLEYRFARGDYSLFPGLAAELVGLPVDTILTDGGGAVAEAAKVATTTIPIVLGTAGDPVAQGLVANYARPGGNITGFALVSVELNVKRLELLRTVFPQARSTCSRTP